MISFLSCLASNKVSKSVNNSDTVLFPLMKPNWKAPKRLFFSKNSSICNRPRYIYLFGESKDWNSLDNLKIFGKVRKFTAAQSEKYVFEINNFYSCEKILVKLPNLSSIA